VLAAADTTTWTRFAPHELGQQSRRIAAVGKIVAVTTVVAKYKIASRQWCQRYRDIFLTETGMRGSAQLAGGEEFQQCFFESPDENQEVQVLLVQSHPSANPPLYSYPLICHNVTEFRVSTKGPYLSWRQANIVFTLNRRDELNVPETVPLPRSRGPQVISDLIRFNLKHFSDNGSQ
jgi:hypothetical protein